MTEKKGKKYDKIKQETDPIKSTSYDESETLSETSYSSLGSSRGTLEEVKLGEPSFIA